MHVFLVLLILWLMPMFMTIRMKSRDEPIIKLENN
jgi:hypothetical protein